LTGAGKAAGGSDDQSSLNLITKERSMTQINSFGVAAAHSELLSRVEAAAYLGVARQTLAIWACTNRYDLPYVKIGKLVKYRKSDLDAFIAKNVQGS
jgi:excisionase family DNA binding protein